jgi:hypothetical protein
MRIFVIWSDLIVREFDQNISKSLSEIGRFSVVPNGKFYTPANWNQKLKRKVELHDIELLESGIELNEHFSIKKITERPETGKNGLQFGIEICFLVQDLLKAEREFKFISAPSFGIGFRQYQDYLKEIDTKINDSKSFSEMEMRQLLEEKNRELESLKNQLNDMKD